jgi:hypothetical protein
LSILTISILFTIPIINVNAIDFLDLNIDWESEWSPIHAFDIYDLLIITPSYFTEPLYELANHKISYGLKTKIITLYDIFQTKYFPVQGRDNAEKIKYFIKSAIENWGISYVMLVGSVEKMPMREICMWEYEYVTDLYYADIYDSNGNFCSWDSNNNNKFGEYLYNKNGYLVDKETDFVDLKPDVGVGRLACENLEEVQIVVDKIINYEKNSYNQEWFKRMILCGGETFPTEKYSKWWQWKGREDYEGEYENQLAIENMSEFNPITLWKSDGTLSIENITKEINIGAGFALFSAHGYPLKWGNSYEVQIDKSNVQDFDNGYKLPIVFFSSCNTGMLDYKNIFGVHKSCIAWSFVSNEGGGAIATIGASHRAMSGPLYGGAIRLALYFYNAYDDSQPLTLSQMFNQAQNDYIENFGDRLTLTEFNLLGDPSLKIGGYSRDNCKEDYSEDSVAIIGVYDEIEEDVSYFTEEKSFAKTDIIKKLPVDYIQDEYWNANINNYNQITNNGGWPQIYDGGDEDVANAITIDSENNVIVTGFSYDGNTYNYKTIKYDSNGIKIWKKVFDSGKQDMAYDIAVDSDDNILIVGFVGTWKKDFFPKSTIHIIKYDTFGVEIWNKTYQNGFSSIGFGISIDSEDNVVITGVTYIKGDPVFATWIIKCNGSDGSYIKDWTYHKFFQDIPYGVAIDSCDNIIIIGRSHGYSLGYLAVKFESTGNLIWEKRYNIGYSEAYDVVVDSKDNIIITGVSFLSNIGLYSDLTLKVDKDGNILWKKRYDTKFSNHYIPWGITVDSYDNIILCGMILDYFQKYLKPFIIMYNENGDLKWIKKPDFLGTLYGVAVDHKNEAYATGIKIGLNDDFFTTNLSLYPNKTQETLYKQKSCDQHSSDFITICDQESYSS